MQGRMEYIQKLKDFLNSDTTEAKIATIALCICAVASVPVLVVGAGAMGNAVQIFKMFKGTDKYSKKQIKSTFQNLKNQKFIEYVVDKNGQTIVRITKRGETKIRTFAIDLIEHFTKEELFELLRLIHHALKPGGLFVLQTPNGEGLMPGYVIYGDLTHFTILSPLSLKHILTVTGFDGIKIKELGPGLFIHFPLFIVWQIIRLFAMFIKFMEIGRIQRYWTESIIASARRSK